jgi:hypothetical protein
VMSNRGRSSEEIERLGQQLLCYYASASPFNQARGGVDFVPRLWWVTLVTNDKTDMLKALAVLLFDIVPHSAATERTFSIAGWMHSKTRNRMSVGTTGKLSTIKLHYNAQRPPVPPKRVREQADKRKKARTDADTSMSEAAAERGEVEVLEPTPLDDNDVSNEEDTTDLIEALAEAFEGDGQVVGGTVDDADADETAAAQAEEASAKALKDEIYKLGVAALKQRLLSSWPGVDLTSSKLYPSAAAAVAVTQQCEHSALGTNTKKVDIAAVLQNMLG